MTIDPKDVSVAEFHSYLLGAVSPRPIAFASTVDKEGNVNLSPFSFFNCFGANPPTLIFSPARRVRDNTTKHTLENVQEVPEVVINVVSYGMVEQMSLASTEYGRGVSEFQKAGFTPEKSDLIAPPRVKEAPAAFECIVKEIVPLGEEGGAGNLIICEVVRMHLKKKILDENGKIDPYKIDTVGRMGGDWYVRASGKAIFEVAKPVRRKGIGVDELPDHIRFSTVLTGNDLGKLGNTEQDSLPSQEEIRKFAEENELEALIRPHKTPGDRHILLHKMAHKLLKKGEVENAWKVLLYRN